MHDVRLHKGVVGAGTGIQPSGDQNGLNRKDKHDGHNEQTGDGFVHGAAPL